MSERKPIAGEILPGGVAIVGETLADVLNLDTWTETRVVTCEHHACRCAQAAELAAMADRTGNARLLAEAIEVHHQRVRCRTPAAKEWERGK